LGITNTRASLRYRVVVDGQGQSMDDVRAVSPGAFQTWLNGRSLIQVGAFANLENANEVAELLAIRGIQAEIQPMQ
jgi:cell division septation protein DedD